MIAKLMDFCLLFHLERRTAAAVQKEKNGNKTAKKIVKKRKEIKEKRKRNTDPTPQPCIRFRLLTFLLGRKHETRQELQEIILKYMRKVNQTKNEIKE